MGAKAIEPPGEARSNHDMLCALAKRLGADHPAFGMSEWELIDRTLELSGYPGADELKSRRLYDVSGGFEDSHFLNGFPQQDGKFHFRADWGADAGPLTTFPDFVDFRDNEDEQHPFRLITGPARNYLNSSFTETPTSRARENRPTAKLNPLDCDRLGVADGDRIRIGNARGDLLIHVERREGVRPGTAVVETAWPNAAYEEGIGINLLTSAEPAAPSGGAAFHDTAICLLQSYSQTLGAIAEIHTANRSQFFRQVIGDHLDRYASAVAAERFILYMPRTFIEAGVSLLMFGGLVIALNEGFSGGELLGLVALFAAAASAVDALGQPASACRHHDQPVARCVLPASSRSARYRYAARESTSLRAADRLHERHRFD